MDRLPFGRMTHVAELSPDRSQAAQLEYASASVMALVEEVLEREASSKA